LSLRTDARRVVVPCPAIAAACQRGV